MNMRPTAQQSSRTFGLALLLAALIPTWLTTGCEREQPPGAQTVPKQAPRPALPTPTVALPEEPAPETDPVEEEPTEIVLFPQPLAWEGPYFAVTRASAGVYSEPKDSKDLKIGYMTSGGRTPVLKEAVGKSGCSEGWRQLAVGGFICGNAGTTDLKSSPVKLSVKPPNIQDILPYPYARNTQNGTPLYLSVPSREQMDTYEPYLKKPGKTEKVEAKPEGKAVERRLAKSTAGSAREAIDGGAPEEKVVPWWQDEEAKLNEVTLERLGEEADGVISKRMVKGFYVAVDRTFQWSGRTWYKTTRGLVAPADRLSQTTGSDFKGVELKEEFALPMGWVYGWSKSQPTYEYNPETKQLKPAGSQKHFAPLKLTGKRMTLSKKDYVELADGTWMRESHLRITEPGPPPADLGPKERWIDVNLSTQTLVAFIGTTPYYATLLSSGKTSTVKEKDHSTPTGEWRIREKHITTTMDGDGSAAGDLPYSIEDVPYVMYFHRSYALHGAFWHRNYGTKMSHGCVNLAPLDAKFLFFFADPPLPEGLHGVWSDKARPGSRVVVHE